MRMLPTVLAAALFLSSASADQVSPLPIRLSATPPAGTVTLPDGHQVGYAYHFDHNALVDAERVGNALIARTASGNLLRFDAVTLALTDQAIISGRATAIAADDEGRLLMGTGDGDIVNVNTDTLARTPIAAAPGRVAWLARSGKQDALPDRIVAVVGRWTWARPWPGEHFEAYDRRHERLMRRQPEDLVAVYSNGKPRLFNLRAGANAFALDPAGFLWMGLDRGEFGGALSRMDLRTGRIQSIDLESGILGFVRVGPRLLAYGGMAHIVSRRGYIATVDGIRLNDLVRFENSTDRFPPPRDPAKPDGPIDIVTEDGIGGFWIVSEHVLYHADADFTNWRREADLGGRFFPFRSSSVGSTPTVSALVRGVAAPHELLIAMGRDGLRRVLHRSTQEIAFAAQLEAVVADVWPTSIGRIFLNDGANRVAMLDGEAWRDHRLLPTPAGPGGESRARWLLDLSSGGPEVSRWDAATVVGDDGKGIVAVANTVWHPGERSIQRLDETGRLRFEAWEDWKPGAWETEGWGDGALMIDGRLVEISGGALRVREGDAWRTIGTSTIPTSHGTMGMPSGRRFVSLVRTPSSEYVLDSSQGRFLKLDRAADGTLSLQPLSYSKGRVPMHAFDAVPDGNDWVLVASPEGLVRFRPETGETQRLSSPNPREAFTSIARDREGLLWVAGDHVYVSRDDGRIWTRLELPMSSSTHRKRLRPDPSAPHGMFAGLEDRGLAVFGTPSF